MRTYSLTTKAKVSLATILTAGLTLAGCGTDDEAEQPPPPDAGEEATLSPDGATPAPDTDDDTPEAPDQDTVEPEPADPQDPEQDPAQDETAPEPVGEFSTQLQQSEAWPAFGDTDGIYPVEVRAAVHDGFERIVIEHAGTGRPSYMAQYTEEPVEPGRGNPIDTGDAAYLEVIASGTASYDEFDQDRMIENGAEITDLQTEATGTVVSFAPWEGTSNYIIGLDEQRPYTVAIFEDPVRIVVDIQLDDG